ncbi:MAG: hypothetical protein PHX78_11475 [bacterium]|nr:hypothetical protein [bacterium]
MNNNKFKCLFLFLIILFLMGCAARNIKKQSDIDLKKLEERAKYLNTLSDVHARNYVQIYFELANAYMSSGRNEDAIAALTKGLRVNSWDYGNQYILAKLEIKKGFYQQASERLNFIIEHCNDPSLIDSTKALLSMEEFKNIKDQAVLRPNLHNYKLYILKFKGANPLIVTSIASRITQEFGLMVEIIEDEAIPSESDIRNKASNQNLSMQKQYNATILLDQILKIYKDKLSEKMTLGILGIIGSDIYAEDYNFLFGLAREQIGVISYARFFDNDLAWDIVIKRSVMQAFSSTGFILGIPRCTTATCARAYPHNLSEHDRKDDKLCMICLENLNKKYATTKTNKDQITESQQFNHSSESMHGAASTQSVISIVKRDNYE